MDHTETQKITVEVPKGLLADARKYWGGAGITETVRKALEHSARIQAFQELKKLRGCYTPSVSVEEMRSWEEDE